MGMNFEIKEKGAAFGAKPLIILGGQWATRTPGLWFLKTNELQKNRQMLGIVLGN
jgi:hypothetical protein